MNDRIQNDKMSDFSYPHRLDQLLRPTEIRSPKVVDLFAGCGGLALGFEAQGFETHGFEMNSNAVATYKRNLKGECTEVFLTPETELPSAKIVIGGPPCQPFSVGGHQRGLKDSRDGFPIFISAVRRLQPDLFLFENVRGMFYRNRWYLDQVTDALRELGYIIETRLLNAVDFGVPQNRERIVVVGHKGGWCWPKTENHHITAGEAVGDLAYLPYPEGKYLNSSMDAYVAKYETASKCVNPRDLHMHRPSRTVTCRNLAGATGDMHRIKMPDGRRRRLTPREGARLQSFPDWFQFVGSETEQFNQIGNAVAPMFAWHLAKAVRNCIDSGIRVSDIEIHKLNTVQRAKHGMEQLSLW